MPGFAVAKTERIFVGAEAVEITRVRIRAGYWGLAPELFEDSWLCSILNRQVKGNRLELNAIAVSRIAMNIYRFVLHNPSGQVEELGSMPLLDDNEAVAFGETMSVTWCGGTLRHTQTRSWRCPRADVPSVTSDRKSTLASEVRQHRLWERPPMNGNASVPQYQRLRERAERLLAMTMQVSDKLVAEAVDLEDQATVIEKEGSRCQRSSNRQ
jgi:hypothetical protein